MHCCSPKQAQAYQQASESLLPGLCPMKGRKLNLLLSLIAPQPFQCEIEYAIQAGTQNRFREQNIIYKQFLQVAQVALIFLRFTSMFSTRNVKVANGTRYLTLFLHRVDIMHHTISTGYPLSQALFSLFCANRAMQQTMPIRTLLHWESCDAREPIPLQFPLCSFEVRGMSSVQTMEGIHWIVTLCLPDCFSTLFSLLPYLPVILLLPSTQLLATMFTSVLWRITLVWLLVDNYQPQWTITLSAHPPTPLTPQMTDRKPRRI